MSFVFFSFPFKLKFVHCVPVTGSKKQKQSVFIKTENDVFPPPKIAGYRYSLETRGLIFLICTIYAHI